MDKTGKAKMKITFKPDHAGPSDADVGNAADEFKNLEIRAKLKAGVPALPDRPGLYYGDDIKKMISRTLKEWCEDEANPEIYIVTPFIDGEGLTPYWCAQGNLNTALGACMSSPDGITVSTLVSKTNSEPDIDDPSNMRGDRVWLFGGTRDTTVNLGSVQKTEEYYQSFTDATDIFSKYDMAAVHGFPTEDYGPSCGTTASDYINDCDYNSAYELLNHIYGGLVRPTPGSDVASRGELKTFDQNEFINDSPSGLFNLPIVGKRQLMDSWLDYLQASTNLYWDTVGAITDFWTGWMPDFGTGDIDVSLPDWTSVLPGMGGGDTGGTDPGTDGTDPGTGGTSSGTGGYSMDSEGYVFIPSGCRNPDAKCKVHVAFHGCKQGKNAIGDTYARHTGYLEVGELNNIIILFPQAVPDYIKGNPNGCFDWNDRRCNWGPPDRGFVHP